MGSNRSALSTCQYIGDGVAIGMIDGIGSMMGCMLNQRPCLGIDITVTLLKNALRTMKTSIATPNEIKNRIRALTEGSSFAGTSTRGIYSVMAWYSSVLF